jgi:hypothetical protein
VNPETGAVIDGNPVLPGVQPDVPIATGTVAAVAYDDNFVDLSGPGATTLYGIDLAGAQMVRIGGEDGVPSPNGGAVTLPAVPLGPAPITDAALDFLANGALFTAFAVLESGGVSSLYTARGGLGDATLVGTFGTGAPIRDFTVLSRAATVRSGCFARTTRCSRSRAPTRPPRSRRLARSSVWWTRESS